MSTSLAYILNGTLGVGLALALCASMTAIYRSLMTTSAPPPPSPDGGAWTPTRGPEPPRLGPKPSRRRRRPGSPAPKTHPVITAEARRRSRNGTTHSPPPTRGPSRGNRPARHPSLSMRNPPGKLVAQYAVDTPSGTHEERPDVLAKTRRSFRSQAQPVAAVLERNVDVAVSAAQHPRTLPRQLRYH